MSRVRIHNLAISLDGFATGAGQTKEAPFGHAGERLHDWMVTTRFFNAMGGRSGGSEGIDHMIASWHTPGIGAEIMGAGKFGHPGWENDPDWKGAWGPNPPFHTPVFILTKHTRPPIEMEGGTTYHFINATPADALAEARKAAGDLDIRIGGGPTVWRDFIAAGLVDFMHIAQVPMVLGRGVRLWDGLEALEDTFDIEAVSTAGGVTHLTFAAKDR